LASHYHPNVSYHPDIRLAAGGVEEWRAKERGMEGKKRKMGTKYRGKIRQFNDVGTVTFIDRTL
jgi:hypothetical protein